MTLIGSMRCAMTTSFVATGQRVIIETGVLCSKLQKAEEWPGAMHGVVPLDKPTTLLKGGNKTWDSHEKLRGARRWSGITPAAGRAMLAEIQVAEPSTPAAATMLSSSMGEVSYKNLFRGPLGTWTIRNGYMMETILLLIFFGEKHFLNFLGCKTLFGFFIKQALLLRSLQGIGFELELPVDF
ncbi:hypothetical protein C8R48DRAFT_673864 [Suillus tomentosus]|nr:hypothetical protein C8R48DRAFT_673864 [Suillus tomentosus]